MSPTSSVLDRPTFEEGRELVREAYSVMLRMLDRAQVEATEPPEAPERRADLARVRAAFDGLEPYFGDAVLEVLQIVGCESGAGEDVLSRPHASDKKAERLADLLETLLAIVEQVFATVDDLELTLTAARSELVAEQVQALDVEAGVAFGLGAVC